MAVLRNFGIPFTFQFNVAASGTPEQLTVKRSAATIAFNHVTGGGEGIGARDTITDSASGFLVAGFEVGDQITVSGSASNDGIYIIHAVTAGTITVSSRNTLVTEAAGATVKIVSAKAIPDGVSVVIKAKNANTGLIYCGYSSGTALNTGGGGFSLRNNESLNFQISSTDRVWLDCTITEEGVEVTFEKNIAQTL